MSTTTSGLCMGCMSPLGEYMVCPHCGYDNSTPYDKRYRKPGTVVGGRYLVGRLVHKNGEGAIYAGFDNDIQTKVWVREYFPLSIAQRDPLTGDITPQEGSGAQFKALMSDFVDVCNEVKRMGVTEPVIPIENVIGDHGTAYAIYRHLDVVQLETWLGEQGGKLPVAEARELLLPLFNTLSNIHARSVIHRGISPYTVYIDKFGKLYLWDFAIGATRTGGSELEAELFSGYSAPEQYSMGGWQGTWTDVYGAAALFYRVVSGFVPPKSTLIGGQRPLSPLMDLVMDLPQNISDAVADAMNPVAERRTQEIGSFVSKLVQTDLASTAVYDVNVVNEVKKERERKQELRAEKRRRSRYVVFGLLITVALLGVVMWVIVSVFLGDILPANGQSSSSRGGDRSESESLDESATEPEEEDLALPEFVGMDVADVQSNALYQGRYQFRVEEEYHDTAPEGQIYEQRPAPGIPVAEGNNVILYVSKGKLMVKMPELIGKTKAEVKEILDELTKGEFDIATNVYDKYSPTADPGTVVSTSPQAGAEFDPKTTRVTIFYMYESSSSEESGSSSELPNVASSPTEETTQPPRQPTEASREESSRMTHDEFQSRWNQ